MMTKPKWDPTINLGHVLTIVALLVSVFVAYTNILRAIDNHHTRITHVHVKDIRRQVIDALDRTKQSFLDAVALGAFTVPGDGSLDFGAIVQRFADYGYEGWFVVEAEQDPRANPPLKMAQVGHKELMRVMTAAGYTVETQGFPNG